MPVVNSCCKKLSNRQGSIAIGVLLLVFSVVFLVVTIALVAGWEDFDTDFLDDTLDKYNSSTVDRLKEELDELKTAFQEEIRPVWKKEFISLYCFLPWYALVNVLLIVGARQESKLLVLLWLLFSVGFLVWSFVLVSIMFSYDTTPGFVVGVAIAQLCNFAIMSCFIVVVFSFYQELVGKTIQEVLNRGEEYNVREET